MSMPDFDRADYVEPRTIEGYTGDNRPANGDASFVRALLFGAAAAVVGSVGYALFSLTGFMVSIVAVGIGWLVAKSMMTGSGGRGGRPYQVAAVLLTYFAVSIGDLLHPLWRLHTLGAPASRLLSPLMLKYALLGPFLSLVNGGNGINGAFGLLILFFGLRAAWQIAAGGFGFGRGGTRRVGPFGSR